VFSLKQIAEALEARLVGDADLQISGVEALDRAQAGQLSFLSNPRYRKLLASTQASVVLIKEDQLDSCPVAALVVADPYLAYAKISSWFETRAQVAVGISAQAAVDASAQVDASARIAPGAVVEAGAVIEADVEIGPNSVVGAHSRVGEGTRLAANVTLYHQVQLGKRNIIHSGAVIGSDGFGFANEQGRWVKISQIGRVITGDDVEIGACTTVDRGAIEDTLIGDGVKIDNQVQVAHNVQIGEHTAMAGCSAVAGSTKIGRRCTVAGGAGIGGHLEIADDVHMTGMAMVTKSLTEKGVYSSGTGVSPYSKWRKNVVRFNQLNELANRVSELEKALKEKS
jgi:UDP-3-O-[3-hydroxymyristoyl] glucosamine N-acyltransferase